MKEITKKLTRYSAAAGALLAVSAGAQANPHIGTITGSDGNLVLNHDNDRVYLDINNDGLNDLMGLMWTTTSTTSYYSSDLSTTVYSTWLYKTALFGSMNGNAADEDVALDGDYTTYFYGRPLLNKFYLNDQIGPLADVDYYGVITQWSGPIGFGGGGDGTPPALGATFNGSDDGYLGFMMQPTAGGRFYGWAQVQIDNGDVDFVACAMENRNSVPILAGNNVPVPLLPIASAAGLGIVGLMAALKRRKKNVTL